MDNIWRASIWSSLPFGREQGGCVCVGWVSHLEHQGLRYWAIALENLSVPALGHAASSLGFKMSRCAFSLCCETTAAVRACAAVLLCVSQAPRLERMPSAFARVPERQPGPVNKFISACCTVI